MNFSLPFRRPVGVEERVGKKQDGRVGAGVPESLAEARCPLEYCYYQGKKGKSAHCRFVCPVWNLDCGTS